MRLSEHDLLELWAEAETQHPIDRALSALALGSGMRRGALAELSIGERDCQLFELYRSLAGATIAAIARCPSCGEPTELAVSVDELCPQRDVVAARELVVEHAGVLVHCRQPTSRDLAVAALAADEAAARAGLIAATVISARAGELELTPEELGDDWVARIEDALGEMTPPAEILLSLTCPECATEWSAPFDIGDVVWTAAELAARRAMDAVADLGRAYGWTEDVVLALPPARRRYYQERA